ncbi:MAG: tetratricopeptide repeat protein [Pseudomonadota bacterium]|nr:tetratricopeptide repeat protein [Pseudomonadota bacterium]
MTSLDHRLQAALDKHSKGDAATAATLYRAVLADDPQQPDALHMLGVIAQQAGNPNLALKLIEAALATKPDLALAWHNRCLVLRTLGRREEALLSAREALSTDPGLAEAWDMMGSILREQRHFAEASKCLERAIALRPQDPNIRTSCVVLLTACGRHEEAWKLVSNAPLDTSVAGLAAIGNLLKSAGHPLRAVPWFDRALKAKHDFHGARLNKSMALLQAGNMENGWRLWEDRRIEEGREALPAAQWRGERVEHLLLREEQGLGDALQCVRYIPFVQQRVGKITLQLSSPLQKLLAQNLPGVTVLTLEDGAPKADAASQLMSLPFIFGTRLDTIPGASPYLKADKTWRAPWQARLSRLPRPRIGLVWGGNPGNRHNYSRALNFAQLAPLIELGPAHFVSLQKGPQVDAKEVETSGVFDASPYLEDFAATAGLMAELDLVITVCTSPAHLAGAMGCPTFLLLCFDPHWLWLLGREDTPWYQASRLFRQPAPGDWDGVIKTVVDEVKKFIQGDRAVIDPPRWRGPALTCNPLALDLPALPGEDKIT